jgi:diguanylate cyclase (GGDEF)-like protein
LQQPHEDVADLDALRRLYAQEQARVRELEAAQSQLEIYAQDLQRTFSELRRQLAHMNELHQISTIIGSVLEPNEVMTRTLDGLGRLVEHDAACIYLAEGDAAVRRAARGGLEHLPPRKVKPGEGGLGRVLAGIEPWASSIDRRSMTVAMRASGVAVGALHIVRSEADTFDDDDRKLAELVAAEAAAAIQNARLYEQTQRLATTDPQTGLFNYRYFHDALRLEVARARRLGYAVGLLMMDVDNFKRINDTYGHPVGDEVLHDIAAVLQQNVRRTDVVVRYGGEEFAIILPGLGLSGVRAVGEKLRRAVRSLRPLERDGKVAVPITISIGGVSRPASEVDAVALVRDSDAALYEAKRTGKDRVYVAPEEARGNTA